MKKKTTKNVSIKRNKYVYIIMLLVVLWLASWIFASTYEASRNIGNVAVIPIKGTLVSEGIEQFGTRLSYSDNILQWIDDTESNPAVKAIIFEINSPGGTAIAGKEIAQKIKLINKTTVAVIREVGASSGYLIASACDHIIADELSITGSIGAISSYLEFSGFLDKYNITYERLVSADHKDMGSPFRQLDEDERQMILKQLDMAHDYFVMMVAKNRNISIESIEETEGSILLGIQAKEKGLIDEFGNIETAEQYIKDKHDLAKVSIYEYNTEKTFYDFISGKSDNFFFRFGEGFANRLLSYKSYPIIG